MSRMHIVVASHNPVKVAAAEAAFQACFPALERRVEPLSVPSGVSDQPRSDRETRQGAHNRAQAAQAAVPEADYWVGLEGGLERVDGAWLASAWMVVRDARGCTGEARSPTLPLPPAVQALLDAGMELGEANDRVFQTHNSKQSGGAFGLLTQGRLTRGGVYTETLILALIPLTHALWEGDGD